MRQRNSSISITKRDLSLLKNRLDKKIDQVIKELEKSQKIIRFEVMSNTLDARQKLEKQIHDLKDDMFTKIDPILKEVEDARVDRELSTEQAEEFKSKIKELETKVKRLEAANKQN